MPAAEKTSELTVQDNSVDKANTIAAADSSGAEFDNRSISRQLESMADLLEHQGGDHWRIQAYRHAANTLNNLQPPVQDIYREKSVAGLVALPGVGKTIAAAIVEIIQTGHWSQLERLHGRLDPIWLFSQIPGIGEDLAERIVDNLDLDSLEGLEMAAHDGRLANVPGFGPKRLEAVQSSLAERLRPRRTAVAHATDAANSQTRNFNPSVTDSPSIAELLSVDEEYRRKDAAGLLNLIAPKKLNAERKAWLPVLHTKRGEWNVTALYSNTQRAHRLNKTDDWVVLYFHTDHHQEGQLTVVTEYRGRLTGRRVVRGLEADCIKYYESCENI